jgi:hypothetical protein
MAPSLTKRIAIPPIASPTSQGTHCGCAGCNLDAWNALAGEVSCGARIAWLQAGGKGERAACEIVSNVEFKNECGACDPSKCPLRTTPRCGCAECEAIWDVQADSHSCGARITWLQTSSLLPKMLTEEEACLKVSIDEFPDICGACSCNANTPGAIPQPTDSTAPQPASQPIALPNPNPVPRPPSSPTLNPTSAPSPSSPIPEPSEGIAPTPNNSPDDVNAVIQTSNGMETLLAPKHIDPSLVRTRAIPTSKVI